MKSIIKISALACLVLLTSASSGIAQGLGSSLAAACQPPDAKLITSAAEIQLKEQLANLCEGCTNLKVKAKLIKPKDAARFEVADTELVPLSALDLSVTPATETTPAEVLLEIDPNATLGASCESSIKLSVKIGYRSAGKRISKEVVQDLVVLGSPKFKRPSSTVSE